MHAARMHIRAPCPFRGWAGAVQTEGQTCFSSGCAVVPHGPCTLGKGREMFQPLYEVAPCVCVPFSRCGDVHKRSRTITGHIYGYLWRSRGIVSLCSGRGRVWGFRGGIGSHLSRRGGSRSLMLKGYYVLSHLFERYLSIPTRFSVSRSLWARGGGGNTARVAPMAPSARKGSTWLTAEVTASGAPTPLGTCSDSSTAQQ
jgi:hypothetical protein